MTTRDTAPLGAPCWIDLMSSDPDRSRAFYGDLFGWTSEAGGEEYGGYISFLRDGVQTAGCMKNDPAHNMPDVWSVYLAVADAQATADAAIANGGQVHLPPMAVTTLGVMGMVGDPGGAAVGLWQPVDFQGFTVLGEANAPAWFEVHTRAYEPTLAFYRTVFGWDTHTMSDTDDFKYSTLGTGQDQLAGVMDAASFLPEGVPSHWSVYFGVDDTDKALARIEELGGSVVQGAEDTPYGRLATAADPTGAVFKVVHM